MPYPCRQSGAAALDRRLGMKRSITHSPLLALNGLAEHDQHRRRRVAGCPSAPPHGGRLRQPGVAPDRLQMRQQASVRIGSVARKYAATAP